LDRLDENDIVGITIPERVGNGTRTTLECHVLAVARRSVALEAIDKIATLRLAEAVEGVFLTFPHRGMLVALKGILATDGIPGDLRFVAYAGEGQARSRPTEAAAAVPVQVRVADSKLAVDAITRRLSLETVELECTVEAAVGERVELVLTCEQEGTDGSVAAPGLVVATPDTGLVVRLDLAASLAFRAELMRLVIEERRAIRMRQDAAPERVALSREF
jgi:hypothetical protein